MRQQPAQRLSAATAKSAVCLQISSAPAPAPGSPFGARRRICSAGASSTRNLDLPAGTTLRVRLDQDLGSKISNPGDTFAATVADDVMVNGQTVIPKGARADGTVIDAKPLGRFKGGALLEIRLERVHTNWGSYPVATSSIDRAEKGKGKRTRVHWQAVAEPLAPSSAGLPAAARAR